MIRWFKEMLLLSILLVPPMAFPAAGVCPARLQSRTPRGGAAGVLRPAGVGLLDAHSLAAFIGWGLASSASRWTIGRLRAQERTVLEIAEQFGYSRSLVHKTLANPDSDRVANVAN